LLRGHHARCRHARIHFAAQDVQPGREVGRGFDPILGAARGDPSQGLSREVRGAICRANLAVGEGVGGDRGLDGRAEG
jgi:hypothetical protein